MKPTDKQIQEEAEKSFIPKNNKQGDPYTQLTGQNPNGWSKHIKSFTAGAKWAIEQMQPGWVSVEEELPNKEVKVLCLHVDSGNCFICYRTNDCLTDEEKWYDGAMPTHWMSLPEPPKH